MSYVGETNDVPALDMLFLVNKPFPFITLFLLNVLLLDQFLRGTL